MRAAIVMLVIALLGLQVRLWVGIGSLHEVHQLEEQVAVQETENGRLKLRNDLLRAEVNDLRHNLDAIEERARHELGMIRSGETFFLLVDPAS